MSQVSKKTQHILDGKLNRNTATDQIPASVLTLQKNVLDTLNRHYPHVVEGWHIVIDTHGGVLQVRNLMLSGTMGFQIPITKIDPDFRNIARMGGELLERYRIARQAGIDMRDTMMNAKRTFKGELEHDAD